MEDIYVMLCGCKISKSELIFKKGGRRCPDHEEGIDIIIRQCPDCGKTMNLAAVQWPKLRCDSCREERRIKVHAESCASWRRNKKNSVSLIGMAAAEKACGDRWDCIHRPGCFDDALKSGRDNKLLPCAECERYEARKVV